MIVSGARVWDEAKVKGTKEIQDEINNEKEKELNIWHTVLWYFAVLFNECVLWKKCKKTFTSDCLPGIPF